MDQTGPTKCKSKLRRIVKLVLGNLVVLLVLLLVVEVVLRVVPPFDRIVTFSDASVHIRNRVPSGEFVYKGLGVGSISPFKVRIRLNPLGFHDVAHALSKAEGVRRILILGDSQVESLQVPLEETFHRLVEKRLRAVGKPVEVIAMGRGGYEAKQALKLYREFGRGYDPDWVVWSYTDANDIRDTLPTLKKAIRSRQLGAIPKIPDWLRSSVIATLLYTRQWTKPQRGVEIESSPFFRGEFAVLHALRNWDLIVYLEDWPPIWKEAWDTCQKDFLEFLREVRADGKELIVISTTGADPAYAKTAYRHLSLKWDLEKPERLMRELVESNGVLFLSAKPLFLKYRESSTKVIFQYDGHLNQTGHDLVADILYREFSKRLE